MAASGSPEPLNYPAMISLMLVLSALCVLVVSDTTSTSE